mmetsp:Transcript_58023/g.116604  ORF Transcript_58023/g.116604 Transcript_58023/m.116604 type:complete len:92 (-) Transcript_58023:1198-1473(-)
MTASVLLAGLGPTPGPSAVELRGCVGAGSTTKGYVAGPKGWGLNKLEGGITRFVIDGLDQDTSTPACPVRWRYTTSNVCREWWGEGLLALF